MKKSIRHLADIQTGYQFRGKVSPSDDANVCVIQIKDVDENLRVRCGDLERVKVENPDPYLVAQGDVLFLSRGHRLYAALLTEPARDVIATGYFFIVRPKTGLILSEFLAWTINQAEFQEAIRPFVRGTHIPIVSKTDFQDIAIDVPALDVQKRIVTLQSLFETEKRLTLTLQNKRQRLLHAISRQLITGQLTVKGSKP